MDGGRRKAVQQLLRPPDTCILAVQGNLLGLSAHAQRLCAVVKHEGREEYALFIFSVDRLVQPLVCVVEAFYPIRGDFNARTQVIRGGWSHVLVATGDGSSLVLELPGDQFPQVFISQLNKATQLFSQSARANSASAFDWLVGYEACCSGWDRFSKPGQPPSSSHSTNPFTSSTATGPAGGRDSLQAAFPEKWPWSHIITPNSDGSTDVATCEGVSTDADLSEFDPLLAKPDTEEPVPREDVGITVTNPTPSPSPNPNNPFITSSSTNPFTNSPSPPAPLVSSFLLPALGDTMRSCTSDSNLLRLQTEGDQHRALRGESLITRSSENLTSSEGEGDRHCVAGVLVVGGGGMGGSSQSSLSDREQENGYTAEEEEEERGEFTVSLREPSSAGKSRGRHRHKEERKTVSAGRPFSQFEVISEKEVEGAGRARLNRSPDVRDLRKSRDSVLKFRKPSGSKPGISKVNMEQPELAPKPPKRGQRRRAETRARSHSHWVSRYRPGVPVPMQSARESIVQAELRQKEAEFCTKNKLRVFCGTWNVNGRVPPSSLDQFLLEYEGHGEESEGAAPPPHIYAIGFQELDLSAQVLVGVESSREEPWIGAVELTLRKAGNYHKLLHHRLVGIMLLVYINPDLLECVSDQQVEYVTTGMGGLMGNKGGVGARFNLFHTSLCFLNCHFAASMEEVDKRNQDYHTIRNKMLFDKIPDYKYSIMEHDMVFWLGDMNYRIKTSTEMTVDVIKAQADNFQIGALLKEDQLVEEMTKGNIFTEFSEGLIDFKPTYKYDPNTDNWDTSEKHRPPAWCDRVLYCGVGMDLRGYRSHPKMKISDHKPVSAVFDCNMRVVVPEKEREVLEEITRKLDKLENDTLPQVDLSAREFIFTDVKFQVPQFRRLIVTNTGMRPVLVSFIPKLDEESYCKPWIEAKPSSAVVQPLQDAVIVLTVCVDCDTAPALTSGQDKLEDILVLHLEGGKDFFISISGNYLVSCFGSSLETLVHLHTYIREVPVADLLDLSLTSSWDTCTIQPRSSSPSPSPTPSPRAPSPLSTPPHDIPKELFQLVSFLDTHALKQEGLFQESGRQVEMEQIRDVLDIGGGRDLPGSPHSMANCLLLFLSALSEPVIPTALHQRAVECCNQPMLCKQLLLNLNKVHTRSFVFLVSFMKRLLRHSEDNGLDPKLLATIFGDILLRPPANERRIRSKKHLAPISRKKATFMYQFLVNELTVDYR